MAKTQQPMPLRTSADYLGEGWFILEDFGFGSYHLRMTPDGMAMLAAYGEHRSPLDPIAEREFIGLCSLLDESLCMAIDVTATTVADDDDQFVMELAPDNDASL